MTIRRVLRVGISVLVALAVVGGCGDENSRPPLFKELGGILSLPGRVLSGSEPEKTSRRPVDDEPARPAAGTPTVKDFLAVCDVMARDLVMCGAVQSAREPVVVEIRPIENRTDAKVDLTIYPQTIRGMILKSGSNRVAFRDETARRDIVAERSDQSEDPVAVDYESTTDSGASVKSGSAPIVRSETDAAKRTVKKSTEVSGRLAQVDYFLKGFIYAADDPDAAPKARGARYFRFQFRLTDARSGLVVWENDYEVKRQSAVASR